MRQRFERTQTQPYGYKLKETVSARRAAQGIVEFHNDGDKSTHDNFQDWRRANDNGLFINVKSEKQCYGPSFPVPSFWRYVPGRRGCRKQLNQHA
jgi:hypothetical protein